MQTHRLIWIFNQSNFKLLSKQFKLKIKCPVLRDGVFTQFEMKNRQTDYGKGDAYRGDLKKYQNNFDKIFIQGTQPFFDEGSQEQEAGWYFWNETFSQAYGPFNTRHSARTALKQYSIYLGL